MIKIWVLLTSVLRVLINKIIKGKFALVNYVTLLNILDTPLFFFFGTNFLVLIS